MIKRENRGYCKDKRKDRSQADIGRKAYKTRQKRATYVRPMCHFRGTDIGRKTSSASTSAAGGSASVSADREEYLEKRYQEAKAVQDVADLDYVALQALRSWRLSMDQVDLESLPAWHRQRCCRDMLRSVREVQEIVTGLRLRCDRLSQTGADGR